MALMCHTEQPQVKVKFLNNFHLQQGHNSAQGIHGGHCWLLLPTAEGILQQSC